MSNENIKNILKIYLGGCLIFGFWFWFYLKKIFLQDHTAIILYFLLIISMFKNIFFAFLHFLLLGLLLYECLESFNQLFCLTCSLYFSFHKVLLLYFLWIFLLCFLWILQCHLQIHKSLRLVYGFFHVLTFNSST